jgi:HYR domain
MTAEAGTAVDAQQQEKTKGLVLSEDLALTTLVAVATTIVMSELGFGRVSAAIGVAASAFISDVLKNFLVRRRVGKRPLVAVTLVLLLLSSVRDALGAVGRRLGIRRRPRTRHLESGEAAGAPMPFPWRSVVATSAVASAITVGLFTAPELAVGKSLVSDRRTTFFGWAARPDLQAPGLLLPASRVVLSPRPTSVSYVVVADDAHDGAVDVACSPPSAAIFPIGTTTVRCVAADRRGNRAVGAFTVTVREVGGPLPRPTLNLPRRLVFEATGAGGARVPYTAIASDPDGHALRARCTRLSRTLFPLGSTTVTCRASDGHGRTARGVFTVTVEDSTPPSLRVPGDLNGRAGDASGRRVVYAASAVDVVDGRIVPRCRPVSGSRFPIGTTTVTCSAADARGNRARRTFVVALALVRDEDPPTLTGADVRAEATSAAGARVRYTAAANDAVDGALPAHCAPTAGATFALGTTAVRCTATDAAGNHASSTLEVTVVDTTAPRLAIPSGPTVEATSAAGARVSFDVSAVDVVDGDVEATCSPASGTLLPLGTHTVACAAIDRHGNRASDSFDVAVRDATGPTLRLPADPIREAASARGTKVSFNVSATDLVSGPATPSCSRGPGVFPIGATVVSCFAVDQRGNRSNGSFRVSVVDTRAPSLKLPSDSRVEATWNPNKQVYEAPITFAAAARDTVDGAVEPRCEPASGFVFTAKPTGSDAAYPVRVACDAIDRRGNRAHGSFTVTVLVSIVE